MKTVTCATCLDCFSVSDTFEAARRIDGKTFYCPRGHRLGYDAEEGGVERLVVELRDAEIGKRLAVDRLDLERKAHAATKGMVTRLRKRYAALEVAGRDIERLWKAAEEVTSCDSCCGFMGRVGHGLSPAVEALRDLFGGGDE